MPQPVSLSGMDALFAYAQAQRANHAFVLNAPLFCNKVTNWAVVIDSPLLPVVNQPVGDAGQPIFAGDSEIFAEPSNETPLMVRAVCSFVAVAALPVVL